MLSFVFALVVVSDLHLFFSSFNLDQFLCEIASVVFSKSFLLHISLTYFLPHLVLFMSLLYPVRMS